MKTPLAALLSLTLPVALLAQNIPVAPSVASAPATVPVAPAAPGLNDAIDANPNPWTAAQLDTLLGPIALYPDALIALILPASTVPGDVALAARYVRVEGDPADTTSRAWDESVISLAHYPEVVKWMDDNLEWTKQLGEAFREQPADVMNAVQRLRAKARAAGTLVDTPQQQVVVQDEAITIVPTEPTVLYVPYYDPAIVYAPPPYYGYGPSSFITFSSPFAAGIWLSFDCDWHRRSVWVSDRHWANRYDRDWRRPVFPGNPRYVNDPHRHPWRAPAYAPRVTPTRFYSRTEVIRPAPIYTYNNSAQRPPTSRDRDDYSNRRNPPSRPQQDNNRPGRDDHRPGDPRFYNRANPNPTPAPVVTGPTAPRDNDNSSRDRRPDYQGRNQNSDRRDRTPPGAAQNPPESRANPAAPATQPAPVTAPAVSPRFSSRTGGVPAAAPVPASVASTPPASLPSPQRRGPSSDNPGSMRAHTPPATRSAPPPAPANTPAPAQAQPAQPQTQPAQPAQENRRGNPDNDRERRKAQN